MHIHRAGLRSISFELDGTFYLVTFRAQPFGRVSDVKIRQSKTLSGFYYPCKAKIIPQNITALEALAILRGNAAQNVTDALRRVFRRALSRR